MQLSDHKLDDAGKGTFDAARASSSNCLAQPCVTGLVFHGSPAQCHVFSNDFFLVVLQVFKAAEPRAPPTVPASASPSFWCSVREQFPKLQALRRAGTFLRHPSLLMGIKSSWVSAWHISSYHHIRTWHWCCRDCFLQFANFHFSWGGSQAGWVKRSNTMVL